MVGRVLHGAVELRRHPDPQRTWESRVVAAGDIRDTAELRELLGRRVFRVT